MESGDLVVGNLYRLIATSPGRCYVWDMAELDSVVPMTKSMKDASTDNPVVYLESRDVLQFGLMHIFLASYRLANTPLIIGISNSQLWQYVTTL